MAISFNNIPNTIRTPGVYAEIDNSRALSGLLANPQVALIIGQKTADGTAANDVLKAITRDNLADGYFGPGSIAARMCNVFKENNPNTELYAISLSDASGATAASGAIHFSVALSATGFSMSGTEVVNIMIGGVKCNTVFQSGWSVTDVNSAFVDNVNATSRKAAIPVTASTNATSAVTTLAKNTGEVGNGIDIRENYFTGESSPRNFGDSVLISAMAGGTLNPDIGDAWAVIDGRQFHYVAQPYTDTANLKEVEDELADRFLPLVDLQGHGFTAYKDTLSGISAKGNIRNSPHNTIVGFFDSPTTSEEWAAAWAAQAAWNLNNDPARPLHTLALKTILPPPTESRFTLAERNILLYDGIATFIVDTGGNVKIERSITTYQTNSLGLPDPSYLDIQTMATLGEIRFQYKARMINRFIEPRFKLADDTFPVQPGMFIATPSIVKQETIALFTNLRDRGLIENLEEFIDNLRVERNTTDVNRVDVLLPPDLVNQFRVLAALIQFIL